MEALVKQLGFESEKEFHHLVASVDISTPEKSAAFKKWQDEDGSKEGLLKLLPTDKEYLVAFARFVERSHTGHSAERGCTSGICKEIDKLRQRGLI